MNPYRPGPGWSGWAGGGVYDHTSGIRIHACGMYLPPGGDTENGNIYPECLRLHRFIAINGGNRKRGVMAWALAALAKERRPARETDHAST